jgi:NAD(P)-dependent dehydrogenase (short-subunit alcohol dehydrogenase family)
MSGAGGGHVPVEIDFTGKVVLVTGGTKGVGRGIAQRFAEAGATIAVCARKHVDDLPSGWRFVPADIRDSEIAWATVDTVVNELGHLDVLVNNAGGAPPANSTTAAGRLTERIIALNLLAPIYCSQRANHWMQLENGGAIVNIGSVSGMRPSPNSAAYGAAKAGLINFTQTVALEWAPRVRANCLTAGMIRTEQAHLYYGDEDGIAAIGATVPLGRLAWPSEVGDACLFLASPLAGYISGANLVADGGGERPPYIDASNS